jgi:hypothetical protein
MDALDPGPGHQRKVRGNLNRVALVRPATYAGVLTFRVFAHDDPVQVFRRATLERAIDSRKNACWAHVGVLIESLANFQAQTPERNVIGDIRIAGGPKENGVFAAQIIQSAVGHHHAM